MILRVNLFFKIIVIGVVLIALSLGSAMAQSRSELEQKKQELNKDIEMLSSTIKKMSANKKVTLKQLRALQAQLRLREDKIRTINKDIKLLDNQIYENTKAVHDLEQQLEALKKEYAQTLRLAQKNKDSYNKLMFIFSAKDFNQAYRRIKYLQQFGQYRQKQAAEIQQTQKVLNITIVQLDKSKVQRKNVLVMEINERKTLGEEKKLQESAVNTLEKQEKELKSELKTKQQEARKLNAMIQAAIKREIEEARRRAEAEDRAREKAARERERAERVSSTASSKTPERSNASVLNATPETAKLSADFLDNKGSLPWPVSNGVISQGMGNVKREKNVTVQIDGVLIQTTPGAQVRSVFGGEVVRVLDLGSTVAVLIRHGEYFSVYANLRSASVSKGQKVGIKQGIGTASTDAVDGISEIKFGVWKGSTPQNPEHWLAK